MRDIVEMYMHWQAGRSIRSIARGLGMDRNTVRKYVRVAEECGYTPAVIRSAEEWAEFVRQNFPTAADPRLRSESLSKIEPFRQHIEDGLETNKVSTVYKRLRDEAGLDVSLATFRRYIHEVMPETLPQRPVVVWRPEVIPGEEGQVDFGRLGMWRDPATGLRHPAWAFALVLAFSRHMFVCVVSRLEMKTWLDCDVLAIEFFCGVPTGLAPSTSPIRARFIPLRFFQRQRLSGKTTPPSPHILHQKKRRAL